MAPIDANIPLSVQMPHLLSPLEAQSQVGQVRQQQQQQALGQQQMQLGALDLSEKQKAISEQDQLKALFQQPGMTVEAAIPHVMGINPQVGMSLQKGLIEQKKTMLELHGKMAERLGQIAGSAVDEPSYHAAIASALGEGLIQQQEAQAYLTAGWTPETQSAVKTLQQQALNAKDAIDEAHKKLLEPAQVAEATANAAIAQRKSQPPEIASYQQQLDATLPANNPAYAGMRASTQSRLQYAKTNEQADKAIEDASQFAKSIETVKATAPIKIQVGTALSGNSQQNASDIADAIESGDQPPTTQGLYRMAGPVKAELSRRGFNLTAANLDWTATQKHLATLNGAQQTRLRQAIGTASESLGVIEDLAKQWDGGQFPMLNKAQLALAKGGALGPKAQQIATNLEAQITDVASELGNVYMGGNSPTDQALGMAAKNLNSEWTRDQLLNAVKLARTNLQIRANSIQSTQAITATGKDLMGGPAKDASGAVDYIYDPATKKLIPVKK